MTMRPILPLILLTALAACGGPGQRTENDADNEAAPANAMAGTVVNDSVIGTAPLPVSQDAFDRLGKIRIGATLAELAKEGATVASRDDPIPGSTCSFARFKDVPDALAMLDGERVVRIDVTGKAHESVGGLRVGQSEADALKALGGKAKVEPHKYTGPEGHYLVLHDEGAPRGLIAETDGKTVERYRFGQWEQVQWVEGCS